MWYFAWVLGLGFALFAGIIMVMWMESRYKFGSSEEKDMHEGFRTRRG